MKNLCLHLKVFFTGIKVGLIKNSPIKESYTILSSIFIVGAAYGILSLRSAAPDAMKPKIDAWLDSKMPKSKEPTSPEP